MQLIQILAFSCLKRVIFYIFMPEKSVHEYFDRKSSDWTITGFLEECDAKLFTDQIGYYLTSLENIIETGSGNRRKKAQELYARYKQGFRPDRRISRDWLSQKSKETTGTSIHLHQPTFKDSSLGIGTVNGGTFNAGLSSSMSRNKADNYGQKKIKEFFPRDITPSQLHEDDNVDHENGKSAPRDDYVKDSEYFDKLVDNVDLSYVGGEEEEPAPPHSKSGIPVEKTWDAFMIDEIDIVKCFSSLRKSLPKTNPEVHPPYWGVLDLTGQHKPTKKMFFTKWNELINDFRLDIGWNMVNLDQSEYDLFDNMEDLKAQQTLPVLNAHLTILKSYLEHLKLPINEGELMICFVAPAFRMSLDPNQEKFQKYWSEQQLVASQERRRQEQDPNDERARVGQKTDIIIALPTGPALEGFICEVSGGLPAGCPKKIWTDKLKLMVGMRDMINRVIKTFPGLLPIDYMKVIVFGCQVIGLQMNLYAMDVRTSGIYRFGMIDKVSLPASAKELPAYEAVHTMLRSLEHRLNKLTDYCTDLKVKHQVFYVTHAPSVAENIEMLCNSLIDLELYILQSDIHFKDILLFTENPYDWLSIKER
ncbi:hypothetical protein GLOIN_2v454155 [Rhizophagus irregularis DAOM 181602=DAOM 197198]|nr:hypothetical protein GLOIN_2v454155 [Rhizophagus irregularis DAOM 181602=DAOM 197198]